jgi:hypothetical protein
MRVLSDVVIGIPQIRDINDNINVGKWIYYDSAIVLGLILISSMSGRWTSSNVTMVSGRELLALENGYAQ